ncbi:ankyrin repeat domain-containing protein [Candidatus Dependentiae bacterium]
MGRNFKYVVFMGLALSFALGVLSKVRNVDKYLYRTAKKGGLKYTKKLIEKKKANANFTTSTGKTPFMRATTYRHKRIVRYLLGLKDKNKKRIVDFDAVDEKGETALHKAAKKNRITIANMLVSAGADINKQDRDGQAPLHVAAEQGYFEIVELLVKGEAKLELKNNKGNTPLHEAVRENRKKVVEFLIKKGANLKTENKKARAPIDDAKYKVKELIEKSYRKAA